MSAPFSSLRELLDSRASTNAGGLAYTFLGGNNAMTRWTYADLHREVGKVMSALGKAGAGGAPALLVYPQGLDFLAAFFACLGGNVVAVPVPAPESFNLLRTLPRLKAIADDSRAGLVLTTRKLLELSSTAGHQVWKLDALPCIATDELPEEAEPGRHDRSTAANGLAYLQYTSGSTSLPSGVMLTHENLMHHLRTLHDACGYGNGATVTWMPHFHDYGLVQGLLQPFFSGDPCYVMSPLSFMKRPSQWLHAISRFGGTHSQAPNFAYDHCVRRVRPEEKRGLDLSSWKAAGNAAEPINPDVLEAFIEAFEPHGFRRDTFSPAYGLAEATLLVSSTPLGAGSTVVRLDAEAMESAQISPPRAGRAVRQAVSCGVPLAGTKVAIVDPNSLCRAGEGRIGEIWVSDVAVAAGYWNQARKSEETFKAYLADTGEGPWLRTGDLGFVLDGNVYVSGRLKDLIIIRGANFAPQDIEWVAQCSHPALESTEGAAFGLEVNGNEQLIVIQELSRKDGASDDLDLEAVAISVREAIAQEFDVRTHTIALVRRGAVLKTSSGKIQRRACRQALLTGTMQTLFVMGDGPLPTWGAEG
jgi:acyl-CoA synthetase (AMP-forming)/AMP-acid ligase II